MALTGLLIFILTIAVIVYCCRIRNDIKLEKKLSDSKTGEPKGKEKHVSGSSGRRKSILDEGMFEFKEGKNERITIHKRKDSIKSFVSVNGSSGLNESMSHLMDYRSGDVTTFTPGMSRNGSMSILDQVYVTELVNNVYTKRNSRSRDRYTTEEVVIDSAGSCKNDDSSASGHTEKTRTARLSKEDQKIKGKVNGVAKYQYKLECMQDENDELKDTIKDLEEKNRRLMAQVEANDPLKIDGKV